LDIDLGRAIAAAVLGDRRTFCCLRSRWSWCCFYWPYYS
jgi:hypothetical protein